MSKKNQNAPEETQANTGDAQGGEDPKSNKELEDLRKRNAALEEQNQKLAGEKEELEGKNADLEIQIATKEETAKYAGNDENIGKIPVATIPNVKMRPEGGYAVKRHSDDVFAVVEKNTGKEVRVYRKGKDKGMVPNPKECAETYVKTH